MKYAILQSGSRQVRAQEGAVVAVERLPQEVGGKVKFSALLLADGADVRVGRPLVDEVTVVGTVIDHAKSRKIRVFKYKRRKRYRVAQGHRQVYTRVRIDKIG
ncbi:MAG: 50S ribosomal protein L21 [Anaerolineales bacterium]|jgi:large subunit ribosomal protein L21|nr:50S ribosomal protein L21 [Anaerolineales bacterium]